MKAPVVCGMYCRQGSSTPPLAPLPFLGPHAPLSKKKKSTFTVSFLGPSGGTKNETANPKINAKAEQCNEQKMTTAFS